MAAVEQVRILVSPLLVGYLRANIHEDGDGNPFEAVFDFEGGSTGHFMIRSDNPDTIESYASFLAHNAQKLRAAIEMGTLGPDTEEADVADLDRGVLPPFDSRHEEAQAMIEELQQRLDSIGNDEEIDALWDIVTHLMG